MSDKGWIGVDLDGTLAHYDKWVAWNVIGPPIIPMKNRVLKWLDEGKEVKIFTARVGIEKANCFVTGYQFTAYEMAINIKSWCRRNIKPFWSPDVTAVKDFNMIELWDDRAIQVIPNTGMTLAESHLAELTALRGAP